ncbi:MAG TPA: hypothetical protein VIV40_17040 [Kofleriaceae bacterium]
MARRLVVLAMLALVAGASVSSTVTWAKPARHNKQAKPRKPAPTPDPATGTGSATGAGSAAGSAAPVPATAIPVPAPAPVPAAAPVPVAAPSAAPGADAAPGAATLPTTITAPPASTSTKTLAMRASPAAHNGFVADLDCSACHTADGWNLAATAGASGFDHDRTGFPLRGSHVQTTCSGCHTGKQKPATSCEGCHRDPHQGRNEGTCAECHTAVAWSDTNALERHRLTRMPLTGRHATLECSACHKRTPDRMTSDVPTDCYACHRDRYHDATVHPAHDGSGGHPPFPRDCGQCHQTSAWMPATADPNSLPRSAMRTLGGNSQTSHDSFFVLSTGSHRLAECASCHADARRTKLVRCDGCHQDSVLRTQHRTPVARSSTSCLRCHPRGAAR